MIFVCKSNFLIAPPGLFLFCFCPVYSNFTLDTPTFGFGSFSETPAPSRYPLCGHLYIDTMTKLWTIGLMLLIVSCSPTIADKDLIGQWVMGQDTIQIHKDGTFIHQYNGLTNTGKWTLNSICNEVDFDGFLTALGQARDIGPQGS